MEQSYKARFFDGRSSQPRTVDVSIVPYGLLVTYVDDNGNYVQHKWLQEQIKETEFSSRIITLRYGDNIPYQQLEITDKDFFETYKDTRPGSWFPKVSMPRKGGAVLFILLGVVLVLWASYALLLPFLADIVAKQVPKSYEIDLGQQLYESVLKGEEIDSAKTEQINLFFKQLKTGNDYPIRITVVKSDIVNAFALPGGGIVVYDKILEGMDSENELAALLAHEYSHVQLKHATRNIIRSLGSYIFVSILVGDMSGATAVILQNAETIRSLSYTRSLESEADQNGLMILKENHLPADGMTELFNMLKKESNNNVQIMEILSTHPDLDHRIDKVHDFTKANSYQVFPNDSLHYYFTRIKND